MCGRFTLKVLPKELEMRYGRAFDGREYRPSYNIAPSRLVPTITPDDIVWMRWGMVPFWWKRKGRSLINIRKESLAEKQVFKNLFKQNRCLIPADGFYEWKKIGNKKQPFYFKLKNDEVFSFAGIWEKENDGLSNAIVTCEPNDLVLKIHDRMPCILTKEDEEVWLKSKDEQQLLRILNPYQSGDMEGYEVGFEVNSVSNDDKSLVEKL